jgi:hypothetical protein
VTALQRLDLKQAPDPPQGPAYLYAAGGYEQNNSAGELSEVLPLLPHLTQLCLEWQINEEMKLALGALTLLKDLRLRQLQLPDHLQERYPPSAATAVVPDSRLNLPRGLTRLEVHMAQQFCSDYTPDLASLAALQHLQHSTLLDAILLPSNAQLTHLQLCMKPDAFSTSNLSILLNGLAGNEQLRHLHLEFGDADKVQYSMIPLEAIRQCSAFTASSHLTSLQLSGVQLPSACGKVLFPSGHVLPHLTILKLRGNAKRGWDVQYYDRVYGADGVTQEAPIGSAGDIYSLIECCPNLVELDLAGSVQPGVNLSALRHLQRLTSLVVGGQFFDDGCAAGLAEVTGLRKLVVIDPSQDKEDKPARRPYPYSNRQGSEDSYAGCGEARVNVGGHFTFKGLHSLMQLKGLSAISISQSTCLFQGLRWSDICDFDE